MDDVDSVLVDVSPTENEENKSKVLELYKTIRTFSNTYDRKNLPQIKKFISDCQFFQNREALRELNSETLSAPEKRENFRNKIIDLLLDELYSDDHSEVIFGAAAKFDLELLGKSLKELQQNISNSEIINQTRDSDTVLVFALKYGNIKKENFLGCVKMLLESGININKFDVKGKSAIDYIALSYKYSPDEPLKSAAQLFLDKGIYTPDESNPKTSEFLREVMKVDMENHNFVAMDPKTKLFYLMIKHKKDEDFLVFAKKHTKLLNEDDGENTLLQLASKRGANMEPVVEFLLDNGADPNKTTSSNKLSPLEIAAMNNNPKVFEIILKNKKTQISASQYNNFVRSRSQPMKVKLFELLLESNKLDSSFTYDKTGNTPLHYAIIFSHKKAIQSLLQRQSSLVVKNKVGKRALDIIDSDDLEKYFDSCLALDNYTPYFTDGNYKMRFRFNCLIDHRTSREVKVVSKIGKRPNLEHLLTHPFVHTFITLKWFKIKLYFWIVLFLQASIFLLLSVLFYRLSPHETDTANASMADAHVPSELSDEIDTTDTRFPYELVFCVILTIINIAVKAPIFLYFHIKNRRAVFYALNRATLHGFIELLLMISLIGSFFQNQFRAFIFIEMAVSFLLTAGYYPRLSKWSLMLQQVFKTFTLLLIFFSLFIVAFSIGFHILFPDQILFQQFFIAIFKTFIMTTGEFNIDDDMNFDSGFSGYVLFLLFAMSISLVIVNFWTGVAVTDIERIEKNSEINASKNVIIFMLFIDFVYAMNLFVKLRKYIPNPLLFLRINDEGFIFHRPEKCDVDFYVNKSKQFEEKGDFPSKVDDECFNKISGHYHKLARVTSDKEILIKLDQLTKMIKDLETKIFKANQGDAPSSESKQKKDYKKKK